MRGLTCQVREEHDAPDGAGRPGLDFDMNANAAVSLDRLRTAEQHDCSGLSRHAGSRGFLQTRLLCNPIGQPKDLWAHNVGSEGALAGDHQQDDTGGELFREFAVAPEDVFGDDVHMPDIIEEVVEDNGFIVDQAAQPRMDSPAFTTSSLTFRWWHTQQGKEVDSPSVGQEETPYVQRNNFSEGGAATKNPRPADVVSADLVQPGGQGDAGKGGAVEDFEAEEEQERGDDLLESLPGSPGGLAHADLLGSETHAAAPDVNARPADAIPLTQAPDLHNPMGPSQDAFATQETPKKAAHDGGDTHGASRSQLSSQKTTMFGKGLKAMFSPLGRLSGIFGDKGRGDGQKHSSQAEGSQLEAHISQPRSTIPATPLSPPQEGTGPMSSLSSSPRGAAVRQGLDLIEQAHRLGVAGLRQPTTGAPSSGSGKVTASAGAAAGLTDAHDADGPLRAQVEVNGQAVNAGLLQPPSAEAATETPGHRMMTPSGVPVGADCDAVVPVLAPEAAAQQPMPLGARPSRKRMEPGADAPGAAAPAAEAEGSGGGAPESEPRQQKRRLLTGMAVVWRYFGLKDPKAPQAPTG